MVVGCGCAERCMGSPHLRFCCLKLDSYVPSSAAFQFSHHCYLISTMYIYPIYMHSCECMCLTVIAFSQSFDFSGVEGVSV